MILAAIPAIAGVIGSMLIGGMVGAIGGRAGLGAGMTGGFAIVHALVSYVITLIVVYVVALIVDALAPTFGGTKDFIGSLKLVAYSYTAAWLSEVSLLLGMLGYLLMLIATIYAFYTFVLGAPVLGKSSAEKAIPYTLVVVLCAIVLGYLSSFVFSGMTTMAPAMNSGVGLLMR
jgi:hypothetical protein